MYFLFWQVVSAPTGSGKTGILELTIIRLLATTYLSQSGDFRHIPGQVRVLYLAPNRALVQVWTPYEPIKPM